MLTLSASLLVSRVPYQYCSSPRTRCVHSPKDLAQTIHTVARVLSRLHNILLQHDIPTAVQMRYAQICRNMSPNLLMVQTTKRCTLTQTAHTRTGREYCATMQRPIICNKFLDRRSRAADTVVIVLNWTLPACSSRIIQSALLTVAADGGSNQLYDELPLRQPEQNADQVRLNHLPHAVIGDLDSAREEVLSFYSSHDTEIVNLAADQDSTDLGKCLSYIGKRYDKQQLQGLTIIVLGAMGGRIDHAISNLNTLATHDHLNLVLVGDNSTARLLPVGHSEISLVAGEEGPTCSLVPLMGPTIATTKGLKWDLSDTKMQFGGLISTSNTAQLDSIHVECDQPLMWTTEFNDTL